jgi:hypothetical protein
VQRGVHLEEAIEMTMSGCCYSCKWWEFAKIKQAIFDVKKEFSGEEITVEFGGKEIRIPSWEYSITKSVDELIKGIKDGSVRYCNVRLVRPWSCCDRFDPRIVKKEININSGEEYEAAYLSCWTEEGCPFKERCYKERRYSYVR